jgi:hypothetical protein
MLVDRDDHRRALASTERLHNLCQSAFPTWFVSSVRPGTIVDEEWGRSLFVRAQTERSSHRARCPKSKRWPARSAEGHQLRLPHRSASRRESKRCR